MRSVNGEIELKLEVDARSRPLLLRQPLLEAAAAQRKTQLSVYYDTAKGALRKHGYSLRVRSANGGFVQTVKPTTASAGLFARDEWESDVDSIEPDLGKLAGLPLEPLWRDGKLNKLAPVVRSQVERTSWLLEQGENAFQIDFDEGTITAGGNSQPLCELELELVRGESAQLVRAARELAGFVPMRIGVLSKADRGFALADGSLGRVSKADAVAVDERMTVADAFTVIGNACIKHYRLNEPLVIASQTPEALHQARVAMRRLRSAFTLFRSAVRDAEYERLRQELRWFTAQLGDARNLDVYLQQDLPEEERRALTERREQAYRLVIDAMGSQRLRDLMLDLVGWVALGDWRSGKQALRPIGPYAEQQLEKLWSTIEGPAAGLAGMEEEARHELRIQVKKLRYAVEFLRGVFPAEAKRQKRFAAAAEGLQEALGKLNDLATARTLGLAGEEPDTDQDAGEHLAEAERHAARLNKDRPFWRSEATHAAIGWLLPAVGRKTRRH